MTFGNILRCIAAGKTSYALTPIYCTQFLGEKISGTLLHAKFKVSPGAIAIAATIGLSQNRC